MDLTRHEPDNPLATLSPAANRYARLSAAPATVAAYASSWSAWSGYAHSRARQALPADPSILADWISSLADRGHRPSYIARHLAAVNKAHTLGGYTSPGSHPAVRMVLEGIRRELGSRPAKVDALLPRHLMRMILALPADKRGMRDRALLTVGFAGAFRRSELVAVDLAHIEFGEHGATVQIPRSKTDQEGQGREVHLPYGDNLLTCPVRSLQHWLSESQISDGAVFRDIRTGRRLSAKAVERVIKASATRAGLRGRYAGHSLRAGLVTAAAEADKSAAKIAQQTGHRRLDTILEYVRKVEGQRDSAAKGVGL